MRAFLVAMALGVGGIVVGVHLVPTGETVRVYTRRPDGAPRESVLWLVERNGHAWLRAGRPDAEWLERIHGEPRVEVARNGRRGAYRAVPVEAPDARAAVNEAMARKYGLADRLVRWLVGVDDAVPVRLDPLGHLDPLDHLDHLDRRDPPEDDGARRAR